jgi:hypothetical protein
LGSAPIRRGSAFSPHTLKTSKRLQTRFNLLGFVYAEAGTLHRSHHFLTEQRGGCAQRLAMHWV